MRVLFSALSLALALPLTQGAQLSLTDFTCASGYPVEVLSFLFECSGSSCTFGDTANFTGWCKCYPTYALTFDANNISVFNYSQL